MELRDKNNTLESYNELLEEKNIIIIESMNKIKNLKDKEKDGIQVYPIPNNEVIKNTLLTMDMIFYDILFINYSIGKPVSELLSDYSVIVTSMENSWKKIHYYRQMMCMLSMGIMLDVSNEVFNKLVNLVKKYNLNDYLIDLLINYKMPEWERKNIKFLLKKPYQVFEEIELLARTDKDEAIKRLKRYLQKQWLPTHDTSSRGKSYHTGYWSFESGAIVKIFNLDDEIIKNLNYYPYDMVHWNKLKSVIK